MSPAVAVVDCGTNTTRLLVQDGSGTIARLERITRLGRGVDATGRLGADGLRATLEVLREYTATVERHGAERVRVLATSAARDAANASDLVDPLRDLFGVEPEVLSGAEEGRLSFLGAVAELPADGSTTLTVDIGGGSTELSVGVTRAEGVQSLDIGSVRLTERYLHGDPPRPEELSALLSVVEIHLDDVARDLPAATTADRLVGLAGTVTTVAAVEIGLLEYDRSRIHHFALSHAAAEDVFRTLATESLAARVHNPGLDPARADVIVAGTANLVAVMRKWGYGTCLVSEADLLDGAARELLVR